MTSHRLIPTPEEVGFRRQKMLLRRRRSKYGQVLRVPMKPARRLPAMWGKPLLTILFRHASHTRREDDRRGWRNQTGDWQKRGYELSERARTAAPAVSQAAADAGQYVAQNVREHPIPGAVIAGAVVCMLGYLLYRRD